MNDDGITGTLASRVEVKRRQPSHGCVALRIQADGRAVEEEHTTAVDSPCSHHRVARQYGRQSTLIHLPERHSLHANGAGDDVRAHITHPHLERQRCQCRDPVGNQPRQLPDVRRLTIHRQPAGWTPLGGQRDRSSIEDGAAEVDGGDRTGNDLGPRKVKIGHLDPDEQPASGLARDHRGVCRRPGCALPRCEPFDDRIVGVGGGGNRECGGCGPCIAAKVDRRGRRANRDLARNLGNRDHGRSVQVDGSRDQGRNDRAKVT